VDRATGDTYGPADVVQSDPSYGYMTAASLVRRLVWTADLDADGLVLAGRFIGIL
jgi:hypothetical protein